MITITHKGEKAWINFVYKPETETEILSIAGDFNDWQPETMRAKKDGSFYIRKYLESGRSYQFRYVVNETQWLTDDTLFSVENPFGTKNSVISF